MFNLCFIKIDLTYIFSSINLIGESVINGVT